MLQRQQELERRRAQAAAEAVFSGSRIARPCDSVPSLSSSWASSARRRSCSSRCSGWARRSNPWARGSPETMRIRSRRSSSGGGCFGTRYSGMLW